MRRSTLVVVGGILVVAMLLAGCAKPADQVKPLVTWDGKTAIPFIYRTWDDAHPSTSYFTLGVWDLEKGKVSFAESPLFSLDETFEEIAWDGGDRFGVLGGAAKQIDPRVHVEPLPAMPGYSTVAATPSGSDTVFLAYMNGEEKAVLKISNHPLAGEFELKPELAPGTTLFGAVGIEVGEDEVRVLLESIRYGTDAESGDASMVDGVVSASYRKDRTLRPVTWRVVNPEVPVWEVGGGARWGQFPGQLAMAIQDERPAVLDLVTGAVSKPSEFTDELRKADPQFAQKTIPGGAEMGVDLTYGYKGFRLVTVDYLPGVPVGDHFVSHTFAFAGESLAGRLSVIDQKVEVWKDGKKVSEAALPKGAAAPFTFPQDIQPLSNPSADGKTYGSAEFDSVWEKARYADLFNEALRTDGWTSEQMSTILFERFDADPKTFVHALSLAAEKEVQIVAGLLKYGAGYHNPDEYRQRLTDLKQVFRDGRELEVLDALLAK